MPDPTETSAEPEGAQSALLADDLESQRRENLRRRHRDPVTGRCFRCGRFVPDAGLGNVFHDDWTGGWEYDEGECPKGFGCHA